jgi:undecaprenyl-diphosphatase
MPALTYPEAIVVGLFQGVSELFPVSSLGHSVLIPALIGGRWARDLNVSAPESPYLAFIVGLHVATALALLAYFWRDWLRIAGGFATSLRDRQVATADQRLAWLIILATIPVGIAGLLLEHVFRTVLGKPIPAAIFLTVNGVILYAGERMRRRAPAQAAVPAQSAAPAQASLAQAALAQAAPAGHARQMAAVSASQPAAHLARREQPPGHRADRQRELAADRAADQRLAGLRYPQAVLIGSMQILALLPGISRSGVTMVGGLARGLSNEDAARFAFLLATPVILAAGALKIPDLAGPLGSGIRGQILAGSLFSGIGAYLSVRFLLRYFQTRTLTPFAIYCVVAGLGSLAYLTLT